MESDQASPNEKLMIANEYSLAKRPKQKLCTKSMGKQCVQRVCPKSGSSNDNTRALGPRRALATERQLCIHVLV